MDLLLKKPKDDFSMLEEQMGVIFSMFFLQALDPALQLVSRDHLPGNVSFPRELHIFCWIEFCYSIRSGICRPGAPAELWEVWTVVATGTRQCPALHRDTRTYKIFCFPQLKDTSHQMCDPSPGKQNCPGDHKLH